MIDDLKKWVPGEPLSAQKLNRMNDAILANAPAVGDSWTRKNAMRRWQPFDVEASASTALRVHAGPAIRIASGSQFTVDMGIDSGTSKDPDDYKTLTGVTSTVWVKGTLNSSSAPTTLTIATSATFPTSTDGTVLAIAYVVCAGGVITRIVQLWNVEWLSSQSPISPDNTSTELCPATKPGGDPSPRAGLLQEYGYDDAAGLHAGTPSGQTARFSFMPGITNNEPAAQAWCTLTDIFNCADWDDAINFTNWLIAFVADNIPTPKHTDLDPNDSVAGALGFNADHNHQHFVKGAAWIESGLQVPLEIANNYCGAIGRDYNSLAILLSESKMFDSLGHLTFDFEARALLYGSWSVADTTDAGSKIGGAFVVAGGIGCSLALWCGTKVHADVGFSIDASNFWNVTEGFSVVTVAPVIIQGGTTTLRTDAGGAAVKTTALGLELDSAGGTLTINGNPYTEQLVKLDINGVPTDRYILARTP